MNDFNELVSLQLKARKIAAKLAAAGTPVEDPYPYMTSVSTATVGDVAPLNVYRDGGDLAILMDGEILRGKKCIIKKGRRGFSAPCKDGAYCPNPQCGFYHSDYDLRRVGKPPRGDTRVISQSYLWGTREQKKILLMHLLADLLEPASNPRGK